ncbi:adenylate/guanylate cyclase domain-containing protein [Poseidonibacter parvus]|uniref:Adenylate/guanylate cyclase domain-containing protein n=1 Tax=Poseidonibacter parvus TaxID=1850254 RepID=A0A1P8KNA7_9BACT|nr:adenylate/guanylate cyclase domain-containing protein [Poseidonibacter parvus]APW66041.1 adenylate/guanylate cyclase domain-containing protein [Poseidonibacter parvus]
MIAKNRLKRNLIYILTSIVLSFIISSIYIFSPTLPTSIDNRLKDYMFNIRGEIAPKTDSIVIIDIDEKSLQKLGQWPWSRDILSRILKNLTQNNIAIIGLDIVFAEEDRTSPHNIFKKLNIKEEDIVNYDFEFAQTIASTPTILGYQFEFEDKKHINKEAPSIQTIFIEKNKKLGNNYLLQAKGTILNIPVIQDNSYSSGFFNNIPDNAGVIRSVPLIISYDEEIYPSLALETLRIALGIKRIYINYDENGVKDLQLDDYIIPTDRHGRLLINFRGKEKTFKYISALDIYNNDFKKEDIENKIALIGTSAAALMDLRATPFESIFPGVEVHANAIDNIIAKDFLYEASWVDGANIFLIFFLVLFVVFLTKKIHLIFIPILTTSLLFLTSYSLYYILFNYGLVLNIFFPLITIILATIITIMLQYFYEIKKKDEIKNKFASKVSKDVMEQLLKNVDNNQLQAQNKEITVFFSDIRGFTKISEDIKQPDLLVKYINQYMTPMSEIITKNKGTIDKYIGDAIMAYWNAPFDIEDHEDKAVQSALEQLEKLKELNVQLKQQNQPLIDIGIGITTGIATVGEIGSIGRSDYTVIGDTINIGSRVESLCKFYGVKLIITNFTKDSLKENYIFKYLDYVQLKGKEEAIELWEVIHKEHLSKDLEKELELYNQAIILYKKEKLEEAKKLFTQLNEINSSNINNLYIQRCTDFLNNKNFKKVYKHENK